jgi:hypothetical protein
MSRATRVLAFIIGAIWFIPVSCTTGLIITVQLLSKLDERHIEKGERPHSLFFVVWKPGEADKPFGYAWLEDLPRIKSSTPARSFLMEQPSGYIDINELTRISYRILLPGESEQLIEVQYHDDDKESWSRYRATRSEITPVLSKVMWPGYMFTAFPIAIAFAAAIHILGKWFRRRDARINNFPQ